MQGKSSRPLVSPAERAGRVPGVATGRPATPDDRRRFALRLIEEWLAEEGHNQTMLAAQIGVTPAQVSKMLTTRHGIGPKTVTGFAEKVLEIPMSEFERRFEESPERQGELMIRRALDATPWPELERLVRNQPERWSSDTIAELLSNAALGGRRQKTDEQIMGDLDRIERRRRRGTKVIERGVTARDLEDDGDQPGKKRSLK